MRPRRARAALVLAALSVLAACSSQEAVTTAPSDSVTASGAALLAATEGQVVLRSGESVDMYALYCSDTTTVLLADGLEPGDLPEGVKSSGSSPASLTFPAGSGSWLLPLRDVTGAERPVRVSCLPAGFPQVETSGTFSEWTAFSLWNHSDPEATLFYALVDTSGFPVWVEPANSPSDIDLVDGVLLTFDTNREFFDSFANTPGTGFVARTLDGQVVRRWSPSTGIGLDFHAAEVLPNGNLLGVAYEESAESDPAGFRSKLEREVCKPSGTPEPVVRGVVMEVSPSGALVRRWAFEENLPDTTNSVVQMVMLTRGAPLCMIDVEHLNAVAFYPGEDGGAGEDASSAGANESESGRVLVTGRHMDGAVMLSWPSGEVIWTLGTASETAALEILGDPYDGPVHPHDANLVGDLLFLYDNRDREPSRAVVYRIDEEAGTATLVESYQTECEYVGQLSMNPQWRFGITVVNQPSPGPCQAAIMGSTRQTGDDGLLVGWGSADVSASEFGRNETAPRAELRFADSWVYRAIPIGIPSGVAVFDARLPAR